MKTVKLHIENQVAYITLNHPPVNALSLSVLSELSACIDELSCSSEAKVVVLQAEGNLFAAGADIHEFAVALGEVDSGRVFSEKAQHIFDRIEKLDRPVIAAIQGPCLGGGLELAMSCHMRVAAEEALLGQPELKLGIIPGFGGTQRLARLTNKAKALELILTGRMIKGSEAERIGLVNQSLPLEQLMPAVQQLAESIANGRSRPSIVAALRAVNEGADMSIEDGLKLETELWTKLFASADFKEGVQAFVTKRAPNFKDE